MSESNRQTDKHRQTNTDRQTQTDTDTQTHTGRHGQTQTNADRHRQAQTNGPTDKETDRQTETGQRKPQQNPRQKTPGVFLFSGTAPNNPPLYPQADPPTLPHPPHLAYPELPLLTPHFQKPPKLELISFFCGTIRLADSVTWHGLRSGHENDGPCQRETESERETDRERERERERLID